MNINSNAAKRNPPLNGCCKERGEQRPPQNLISVTSDRIFEDMDRRRSTARTAKPIRKITIKPFTTTLTLTPYLPHSITPFHKKPLIFFPLFTPGREREKNKKMRSQPSRRPQTEHGLKGHERLGREISGHGFSGPSYLGQKDLNLTGRRTEGWCGRPAAGRSI